MTQEILVGIIVAAAACFIVRSLWKKLSPSDTGTINCTCGCTECGKSDGRDPRTCSEHQ